MMAFARRETRLLHWWRASLAAALVALTSVLFAAEAQSPAGAGAPRGSRIVATDDWMSDVISRLRGRGYFAGLSPLAQPWERSEVASALAAIPVPALDTMPRQVAGWMRLLRSEFARELARIEGRETPPMGFRAWAGGALATSPRLDPFFPLREGVAPLNGNPRNKQNAWPIFGGGAWAERGALAAEMRVGTDLTLRRADPDGNFPRRIFDVFPDNETAYLSGRFEDGGIVVGRLRRNWAPVGTKGLMVSDAAFSPPQIGYDIGGRNIMVRGFVAELDTMTGRERYWVAHRIEYLRDDFAISLGESKVYGSRGGPRLVNLNPIEIFFITGDKLGGEEFTNTSLDGQFWLRRGRLTVAGETFVDDIWVTERAPARVAISASTRYHGPAAWLELGLDYRIVASFTYWTVAEHLNIDHFTYHGRGLGDNFSDYDRVTLHASVYPRIGGLRLTPILARQRKGEWDFRMPGVPGAAWRTRSSFFQGVAESLTRVALAGRYQPTRNAFVEWDAGLNLVTNADHVVGRSLTEFGGVMRLGVTWSAPGFRAP